MFALRQGDLRLLGLGPNPTEEDLRARWRALAAAHHPDRGGDATKFAELSLAYKRVLEVVSEAEKACPTCRGTGRVFKPAGFGRVSVACPTCGG